MRIAIVGLGLIGGSLAKAFSELDDITVLGCDADAGVISAARLVGAIDRELTVQDLKSADFVFISLYPGATVDYLGKNAQYIGKNTTVVDCTGVKKDVCEKAFETAKRYGFCFIGCHPMAGTQFSGFAHSRATLFKGADMIAVPKKDEEIEKLQ